MLKRIKKLFSKNFKKVELSVNEKIDILFSELQNDIILVQIGNDLTEYGNTFVKLIQELRKEIKDECGFIIPEIHIQDNMVLQENEFAIYVRGNFIENGFLIPNEEGIRDEFYYSLKTIIYEKINSIFTNDITERYIDCAQRKNSLLIWNITSVLSTPEIKIILSDIINNGKSIKDIGYIFEKIGEEILLNGEYKDWHFKKYDPHIIAKQVAKTL